MNGGYVRCTLRHASPFHLPQSFSEVGGESSSRGRERGEGKATVTVLAPLGVKGEDVGNDGGGNRRHRRQIWTGAKGDEDEERERKRERDLDAEKYYCRQSNKPGLLLP